MEENGRIYFILNQQIRPTPQHIVYCQNIVYYIYIMYYTYIFQVYVYIFISV